MLNIQRDAISSILLLSAKEESFDSSIVRCTNNGKLDRLISFFFILTFRIILVVACSLSNK